MVGGSATARRHTRSDYLTGYGQQGGISATISPAFFEPPLRKILALYSVGQGYCAVTRGGAANRRPSIERGIVPGSLFSGPIALRAWQLKAPRLSGGALLKGTRDEVARGLRTPSGSLGVLIDLGLGKLREGLVSLLFLGKRCFQ
jgi:hypothetical protein